MRRKTLISIIIAISFIAAGCSGPRSDSPYYEEVNFHLRTRADTPLLRTEYQTCNKHLLLTEKSG